MKEPSSALGPKTKVRTDAHLSTIVGFGITPDAAKRRRPNAIAEIVGLVAGAGGDLYWCKHEDETTAPYGWMEFELVEEDAKAKPYKKTPCALCGRDVCDGLCDPRASPYWLRVQGPSAERDRKLAEAWLGRPSAITSTELAELLADTRHAERARLQRELPDVDRLFRLAAVLDRREAVLTIARQQDHAADHVVVHSFQSFRAVLTSRAREDLAEDGAEWTDAVVKLVQALEEELRTKYKKAKAEADKYAAALETRGGKEGTSP